MRKSGYYWVKIKNIYNWSVMFYYENSNSWILGEDEFPDGYFETINEERIPEPEEIIDKVSCEHDYSDGTATGCHVCGKCGDMR